MFSCATSNHKLKNLEVLIILHFKQFIVITHLQPVMKRKKRNSKFLDIACILFQRGFAYYVQEWNRTKLSWKCLYRLWVPFSSVGHILYSKNYLHLCVLLKTHSRFLLVCFSTFFSPWWASESSNHPEFQTSSNRITEAFDSTRKNK